MHSARDKIIDLLRSTLLYDDRVFALWLEGSDGLGKSDEYSDLDFWLDVIDGKEEEVLDHCIDTLKSIAEPDFIDYSSNPHPKIFQRNVHLCNTSEYLLIDICIQSHSRGSEGCTFVKGDVAEYPLVLFDKKSIVKIIDPPELDMDGIKRTFQGSKALFSQRSRLVKYIKRNLFLEACAYYNKYVREPLICLARLIYTPRHHEYMLVHISAHFPPLIVQQLEELYRIQSIEDINFKLPLADSIYLSYIKQIGELYGIE